jgi:hypothetical protein
MHHEEDPSWEGQTQVERITRLEVSVGFLTAKLDSTISEWKDTFEKHAEAEKKNLENIEQGISKMNAQLGELISQNTRWKGAVGGATLVLSTLGAIVWYLGAQLGFSILSLFHPTGK